MDVAEKEILSYTLPPKPPAPARDVRFTGDTKLCMVDDCVIEIMNDGQPIIFNYDIKDGEVWEIVDKIGNVRLCYGVQTMELSSESGLFNLRKSTSPIFSPSFSMFPAHPNPFNPITTLRYDLPTDAFVTIGVYDMLGKKIVQLVNTTQWAGSNSVRWDATDSMGKTVGAGVYLYQVQAGEFVETRKMVLLK